MRDVEYWDNEAVSDPRYAAGCWGMTEDDDGPATVEAILDILETGLNPEAHYLHGVLEIGAGPGRLLLPFARRHPKIQFHGADISMEMKALCEAASPPHIDTNVSYDVYCLAGEGGLECLALHWGWSRKDPMQFQLIYAVELFQHLPDDEVRSYIEQAYEVLMPGGVFISQWVWRGESGPHSFVRDGPAIAVEFRNGWSFDDFFIAVHPDWLWVIARKP